MTLRPLALAIALTLPIFAAEPSGKETPAVAPKVTDGPAKEAFELFNQGKHQAAVEAATPIAAENDPDALFLIGFAAETGQGTEQSRDAALVSYQRAAKAGSRDATYRRALILLNSSDEEERKLGGKALESAAEGDPENAGRILGEAYIKGLFTGEADFENTAKWWNAASEAGDTASIILLSRLYNGEFGFTEKADAAKSLELLRKAAEKDEQAAYLPLGSSLLNGDEKYRDEKEGRKWLQKAIDAKLILAHLALGDFEENVSKDNKAARAAYLAGAEAGQTDSMLRLAAIYYNGKDVEKDEAKALEWIKKAAEGGNPTASYELASILSKAEDAKPLNVYSHLLAAASGGIPAAQNDLGLLYVGGQLGAADSAAAVAWFTRAAKSGFPAAQANLGALYERGVGVAVNYASAGELYSLAANQGNAVATTSLARMTAQGMGTKPDLVKAWALASLAIERGDKSAEAILGELSPRLTPELLISAKKILAELKNPTKSTEEK